MYFILVDVSSNLSITVHFRNSSFNSQNFSGLVNLYSIWYITGSLPAELKVQLVRCTSTVKCMQHQLYLCN